MRESYNITVLICYNKLNEYPLFRYKFIGLTKALTFNLYYWSCGAIKVKIYRREEYGV